MSSYRHIPHPHILHRKAASPVKVADQFSRTSPITRFNTAFALKITAGVGSMWCAYIFAAIALFGLHEALQIQEHLLTQDRELEKVIAHLGCPPTRP
jgi:hypothetical protein